MSVAKTERPEAFWRNATAADVAGIVKTGKPILARVRDKNTEDWREDLISGWSARFIPGAVWINADGVHWKQCQVYDPPQWWLNKPEPGEGYRLLEKLPDEALQVGDEVWLDSRRWVRSLSAGNGGPQQTNAWYRRRIEPVEPEPVEPEPVKPEPVKPEPKYKVDDRVKIIGPVPREKVNKNWERAMDALVGRIVRVKSKRLSVLDDWSSAWFYTVENIYELVREDYLAPAPPAPPSHPMCRCEIAPEQIKPVEGAAHYPKIGDTIFLPEMGRLKVLARGVEVC
jgi:hypothetical protein